MKKFLTTILLIFSGAVLANPIEITPIEQISTAKRTFKVGKKYNFKDIKTGDIYKGEVTYYSPNRSAGKEAQVEISNFVDSDGNLIPGKITLIPTNHKNFQEYVNYFESSATVWIRGSEVILEPGQDTFLINYGNEYNKTASISISPVKPISTTEDELEIDDIIEFKVDYDVLKNGKIYIKSETPVYGKIDYLEENGWCGDNAVIYIKNFKTKDINNNTITLNSELKIDGMELLQYKSKPVKQFFNYLSAPIRGKEIDIKNYDKINFVITIDQL